MSDRTSGGVADELGLEEVLNHCGSALSGAEVGANTSDHLVPCGGALAAKGVGLDVVVEEFVGVEIRAVRRKEEDLDLVIVDSEPAAHPSGSGFYTLAPCRVLDTRGFGAPLGGPAVPASSRLTYTLTDNCGIPAGAKAISANVTVVAPAARGFIRFLPGDTAATSASTLSFSPRQVRANNAILSLSEAGTLSAENVSAAPVEIVIDVNGYFQ